MITLLVELLVGGAAFGAGYAVTKNAMNKAIKAIEKKKNKKELGNVKIENNKKRIIGFTNKKD